MTVALRILAAAWAVSAGFALSQMLSIPAPGRPTQAASHTAEETLTTGVTTEQKADDRLLPSWLDEWDPEERDLTPSEHQELLAVAEAVLDRVSPFDWRAYNTVEVRCWYRYLPPERTECSPGMALWDERGMHVLIAPQAFLLGEAYLHELAAHELAHIWQWIAWKEIRYQSSSLFNGLGPAEYGHPDSELEADCLAVFWGWPAEVRDAYWDCPPEWVERVGAAYQAHPLP
jgi:hypothetical protein